MGVSDDLASNLLNGLYLLFNHNSVVVAYFVGLIISGTISLLKPSRVAFLITASFAILTLGYEYDKHIIEPLREQTLATIAPTPGTHVKAAKLVNLVLSELLPVCFFVLGWGMLICTIAFSLWKNKNSSRLAKD